LWPILGNLPTINSPPFVIGVFCGTGKPEPLDSYLEDFIEEVQILQKDGLVLKDTTIPFGIGSFIWDAPARAYLKCLKPYNSYHGCEKCTVRGSWQQRMVFLKGNAPLKDDLSFSSKTDENYHIRSSPLEKLSIGMVSQFPLDYMHLVCLGVTRKLLFMWISGPLPTRLSSQMVEIISTSLAQYFDFLPSEFNRKPRSLAHVSKWKATEFRTFLLYTGIVVLKNVLAKNMYEHFLLFHVAIKILVHKTYSISQNEYARSILYLFVKEATNIYGKKFLVYNVHSLLHLNNDVLKFGLLDAFSCFPYESYLGILKKCLKTSVQPLKQIHRRLHEINSAACEKNVNIKAEDLRLVFQHSDGPLPIKGIQYQSLQFKDYKFL
jgi:hypothetical protein